MLNIMPMTTTIIYATVYIQFYYFNDYISIVRLQPVVFYIMLCCIAFTYYAHEKTCASFCTTLWVTNISQMKIVLYLHRLH